MLRCHGDLATRFGHVTDVEAIVELSSRVQAALTASGNSQEIGPLLRTTVLTAVEERRCYALEDEFQKLIGCAFVKQIDEHYFQPSDNFNIEGFFKPWHYVHSIMLEPEFQGCGTGVPFFQDVIKCLEPLGGTVLLDCWAGNDKLRDFYERAGCRYVATLPENDYEIAVFIRSLMEEPPE